MALPVTVANTFIDRYGADGNIDHLKLQKLVYNSYGWWLALMEGHQPLTSSRPQVWRYGPVFHQIYGVFAGSKNENITAMRPPTPFGGTMTLDGGSEESQIVDWIWGRYGNFSGTELSDMTHKPGTPWYEIAKKHDFVVPRFLEMDDEINRAYFSELARREGLI